MRPELWLRWGWPSQAPGELGKTKAQSYTGTSECWPAKDDRQEDCSVRETRTTKTSLWSLSTAQSLHPLPKPRAKAQGEASLEAVDQVGLKRGVFNKDSSRSVNSEQHVKMEGKPKAFSDDGTEFCVGGTLPEERTSN